MDIVSILALRTITMQGHWSNGLRPLLIATAFLFAISPAHAQFRPCPRPFAEMVNVIVTKLDDATLGDLYRFEQSLEDVAPGWSLVNGSNGDEVRHFKAYRQPVQTGHNSPIRHILSPHNAECGGFTKHVRVCRDSQPPHNAQTDNSEFDYMTTGTCTDRGATERFVFYASDTHRAYAGTSKLGAALCEKDDATTGRRILSGILRHNEAMCEARHLEQLTFYAPPTTPCSNPVVPENGAVSGNDFAFGATVTYSCNFGYKLNGSITSQCSEIAWNAPPPSCECRSSVVVCPELVAPENGQIVGSSLSYGSYVEFSCREGYALVGSNILVCVGDGQWTHAAPTCQAVSCPELPTIENGVGVATRTEDYSVEVRFQCSPGYELIGHESTGCKTTGEWSNPVPHCQGSFFADTKLQMHYDYLLSGGGCDGVSEYEDELEEVIAHGIENALVCVDSCTVCQVEFVCQASDDGRATLNVAFDLYLHNINPNVVLPDCDSSCRFSNLHQMYARTFTTIAEIQSTVTNFGSTLTLNRTDSPTVVPSSFGYGIPVTKCKDPGFVFTDDSLCVPCVPGTFLLSPDNKSCERCPIGTYQQYPGQTFCTPCADDSTTTTDGADHPTKCNKRISVTVYSV